MRSNRKIILLFGAAIFFSILNTLISFHAVGFLADSGESFISPIYAAEGGGTVIEKQHEQSHSDDDEVNKLQTYLSAVLIEMRCDKGLLITLQQFMRHFDRYNIRLTVWHSSSNEVFIKNLIAADPILYKSFRRKQLVLSPIQLHKYRKLHNKDGSHWYPTLVTEKEFWRSISTDWVLLLKSGSLICRQPHSLFNLMETTTYLGGITNKTQAKIPPEPLIPTNTETGHYQLGVGFNLHSVSWSITCIEKHFHPARQIVDENRLWNTCRNSVNSSRPVTEIQAFSFASNHGHTKCFTNSYNQQRICPFGVFKPWVTKTGNYHELQNNCPGIEKLEQNQGIFNEKSNCTVVGMHRLVSIPCECEASERYRKEMMAKMEEYRKIEPGQSLQPFLSAVLVEIRCHKGLLIILQQAMRHLSPYQVQLTVWHSLYNEVFLKNLIAADPLLQSRFQSKQLVLHRFDPTKVGFDSKNDHRGVQYTSYYWYQRLLKERSFWKTITTPWMINLQGDTLICHPPDNLALQHFTYLGGISGKSTRIQPKSDFHTYKKLNGGMSLHNVLWTLDCIETYMGDDRIASTYKTEDSLWNFCHTSLRSSLPVLEVDAYSFASDNGFTKCFNASSIGSRICPFGVHKPWVAKDRGNYTELKENCVGLGLLEENQGMFSDQSDCIVSGVHKNVSIECQCGKI